jgi:outer membrane protein assembly factor BamB
MFRIALFPLVLFLAVATTRAEDWPAWRGPTGQGQSTEKGLPLTWNGKTGENIRWKLPILPAGRIRADRNQSSPIVFGERVWVTVSYWFEGVEAEKHPPEHHVLCFSTEGKLLWDKQVPAGPWQFTDLRGGYTAPTPATDGQRVYVAFGSAVLAAFDLEGKLVWRKEIVPYNFDVAMAVSPVLVGETVVLVCDLVDANKSRIVAFDKASGEVKWEKARKGFNFCHSTPVLATVQGKPQLLVAGNWALQGVNPMTGDVLWTCDASGDTVSPVLGEGVVCIDSGRGGGALTAIDPTGTGSVAKTHTKWKSDKVPEGFSSPVVVGEYLYKLHSPESLHCWKLSSGESVYLKRLNGANVAASPIATADGRIYCASAGKSFVIKPGTEFEILAMNDLEDGSQASPAVSGGRMYLKGTKYLWCVGAR